MEESKIVVWEWVKPYLTYCMQITCISDIDMLRILSLDTKVITQIIMSIETCIMHKSSYIRVTLWQNEVYLFTTQSQLLMIHKRKALENTLGKGENAGSKHFLLFQQCLLLYQREKSSF